MPVRRVGSWQVWETDVGKFSVEGDPVPKGRPRMTKTGHTYTPKRTKEYEDEIGSAWISLSPRPPMFTGLVELTVNVRERVHAADLDNYVKIVGDALNGLAWEDDKQVVTCHSHIERGCADPGIQVEVRAVV